MPFKLRLLLFYLNRIAKQIRYSELTPPQVRAIGEETRLKVEKLIDFPQIPLHKVWEEQVEMRDKMTIPVRIYQSIDKPNLPVIVFYHGGGFVTRSLDSHDNACRRFAKSNEAIVVSVGYRLAPESKFPIPHQDCYDATVWVEQNAIRLGGDGKGLVVMGDSAGGNLATVVAILARNATTPSIKAQVLIYPTTDARIHHPSIDKYSDGYFLTKEMIQWFAGHYRRTDADALDPLMSPILEKDLSNLPPAFLCTAEYDPLIDEGLEYAELLEKAGNQVVYKEYKGMIHAFMNIPKITRKGTDALYEDIKQFLKAL